MQLAFSFLLTRHVSSTVSARIRVNHPSISIEPFPFSSFALHQSLYMEIFGLLRDGIEVWIASWCAFPAGGLACPCSSCLFQVPVVSNHSACPRYPQSRHPSRPPDKGPPDVPSTPGSPSPWPLSVAPIFASVQDHQEGFSTMPVRTSLHLLGKDQKRAALRHGTPNDKCSPSPWCSSHHPVPARPCSPLHASCASRINLEV